MNTKVVHKTLLWPFLLLLSLFLLLAAEALGSNSGVILKRNAVHPAGAYGGIGCIWSPGPGNLHVTAEGAVPGISAPPRFIPTER